MGALYKKKVTERYSSEYNGVSPSCSNSYSPLSDTAKYQDNRSKYGASEYCNCSGAILDRTAYDINMMNKYAPNNTYNEPKFPTPPEPVVRESYCCNNYEGLDNPDNNQAYYSCFLNI